MSSLFAIMSTFGPGKRQKVREGRPDYEYFQSIDKIEYNNMASPTDSLMYRYYNMTERVHSKTMEEWMKLNISFTEFKRSGYNLHGKPPYRPWDDSTYTIENNKRCLKAFFELCSKLGIKYWTALDADLIPMSDLREENKVFWDDMLEFIQELSAKYPVKLLWLAPDLCSHYRYTSGAITSNDASVFIQAAAQIKKCLEISHKLSAECFLLWPYREGYDAIFKTDIAREIKLFAKLLKVTAEYKVKINYQCQLLIMPYYDFGGDRNRNWQHWYWRENEMIKNYMWDVTSCLYFLKFYNLEHYYKVCSPPGHHMYMASVYNNLGGILITNSMDCHNITELALMMKCIIDQNTVPAAGINLKLSPRRNSNIQELTISYVQYIDSIARALRFACHIVGEQVIAKHVQQRYTSYFSGVGSRIANNEVALDELEEFYKKSHNQQTETPSKCEQLDLLFQRYIDTCDQV